MNGGELANMLTDGWAAIQGDALIELRKLEGAELSARHQRPTLCQRRHVHGRESAKHTG